MTIIEWSTCDECHKTSRRTVAIVIGPTSRHTAEFCAECIRIAGIILARAEKDAAKDDVPSPEGERK